MMRIVNIVLYVLTGCALLIGLVLTDPSFAVVGFAAMFVVYGYLTVCVEKLIHRSPRWIWVYGIMFGLPLAWQCAFALFYIHRWIVLLPVAVCGTLFGLPLVRAFMCYRRRFQWQDPQASQ
jgi:hypothetical protein